MNPRALFVSTCADFFRRIKRPGIDIARLNTDDCRFRKPWQLLRAHASLAIGLDNGEPLSAKSCHAQRLQNGCMDFCSNNYFNGWRAKHSVVNNIPTRIRQERASRRSERRKIGRRRARNKPSFAFHWKAE